MLVVDSNRLTREGLGHLLSGTSFEVVGFESDIGTLVNDEAPSIDADLVLVGITEASARIKAEIQALHAAAPDTKVVVLSPTLDPRIVAFYFATAVEGFLHQDISSRALLASLELILAGERVFPSQIFSHGFRRTALASAEVMPTGEGAQRLSRREREILDHLVTGLSNKGIANKLDVAEATVKVHLKSILRKIGVQNRTQAAIWALNNGMGEDVGDMLEAS